MVKKYICPICGYPELKEPPYDSYGGPSYEICPCCGFEFGFDDGSGGISYDDYRKKWIETGARWFTKNLKPKNWKYEEQLKNIEN